MRKIYKKISGEHYNHIYIVGDIHGCYSKLMDKLNEIEFDFEKDLLVCVGDLIDRGPENIESLSLIQKNWFKCVKGNHDQMAILATLYGRFSDVNDWFYNGGNWYKKLTEEEQTKVKELMELLSTKPLILEINTKENKKIVVCHADYPFNEYVYYKPIENYELMDITWNRYRLECNDETVIQGADEFYFGHTPLQQPLKLGNRNYIDTAAFSPKGYFTIVKVQ